MSTFIGAAATSHALSVAAMEESSRVGLRTADLDHLFLALVLSEQTAGQVLRSLGITLDAARGAVADEHSEQLAALGVLAAPDAGRIVFHETDGYEWSDRAVRLIRRASAGGKRGDASAVLRELLSEPSGMLAAILERLGTTPDEVRSRLDEVEAVPEHRLERERGAEMLSGTSDAFAPASPEQVWSLLDSPARMSEWDPSVGRVEDPPAAARIGDTWRAEARTERPDGVPIAVKPEFVRQQIELVARDEGRVLEWRITSPDAAQANARRVRIELEPAAGGTRLRLALAWERHPDRRRRPLRWFVLRPVMRVVLWMQLSQLGNAIGRAFR